MKTAILTAAAAFAGAAAYLAPYAGPTHVEHTEPYSMFGQFGAAGTTLAVGSVSKRFVIMDVMVGQPPSALSPGAYCIYVTINGNRMVSLPSEWRIFSTSNGGFFVPKRELHLTAGLPVPPGATVGVELEGGTGLAGTPVTVAGYIH